MNGRKQWIVVTGWERRSPLVVDVKQIVTMGPIQGDDKANAFVNVCGDTFGVVEDFEDLLRIMEDAKKTPGEAYEDWKIRNRSGSVIRHLQPVVQ